MKVQYGMASTVFFVVEEHTATKYKRQVLSTDVVQTSLAGFLYNFVACCDHLSKELSERLDN